jgi:hypothetical protein
MRHGTQVAVALVQLSAHMGPAMASTAYLSLCLVHRLVDGASSLPPSPALPLARAEGNGLLLLAGETAHPSHLRCAAANLLLLLCAATGRRPDGSRHPDGDGCASDDEHESALHEASPERAGCQREKESEESRERGGRVGSNSTN